MENINSFEYFNDIDKDNFAENGFIISKCDDQKLLDNFKNKISSWFCEKSGIEQALNLDDFLNNIHNFVKPEQINDIRMHIYSTLNSQPWSRPTFFSLARTMIEKIVGNELVMQNRINSSIMMPRDSGSNIPLHIDAHSGESPFQVVLWLPLTNIWGSKGMYILPPEANDYANKHFKSWIENGGREKVFDEIKEDLIWLEIPYGSYILFSSNLFHGSVINNTNETRWSFNCRFKALFSPYTSDEKGLGSFYLPIQTSPITKIGLKYLPPEGFKND